MQWEVPDICSASGARECPRGEGTSADGEPLSSAPVRAEESRGLRDAARDRGCLRGGHGGRGRRSNHCFSNSGHAYGPDVNRSRISSGSNSLGDAHSLGDVGRYAHGNADAHNNADADVLADADWDADGNGDADWDADGNGDADWDADGNGDADRDARRQRRRRPGRPRQRRRRRPRRRRRGRPRQRRRRLGRRRRRRRRPGRPPRPRHRRRRACPLLSQSRRVLHPRCWPPYRRRSRSAMPFRFPLAWSRRTPGLSGRAALPRAGRSLPDRSRFPSPREPPSTRSRPER